MSGVITGKMDMSSARVKYLINQLDTAVYCSECDPPVAVEVRARVFYRLQDHAVVSCPNGHSGTLREYKYAAANPGEKAGPFVLRQPSDTQPGSVSGKK